MNRFFPLFVCAAALASAPFAQAQKAAPLSALAKMPVKEVTVFKDGHAYVVHSGKMPVNAEGNVEMDYLPTPILGTFWPASVDKQAKLTAVTASQRKVLVERTALALRELIEANIGADVMVTEAQMEVDKKPVPLTYRATIVGLPMQSGEELEQLSPPNSGPRLPVKGSVVLLKLQDGGTKATDLGRILDVTFINAPKGKLALEEFRNLLTLKLEWADNKPQKEAEMGLMYVQRGIRWIPNYKVAIDGKGNAKVTLQATLLNELTDLEDVSCNLVVGVPTFQFKETADPMGLQNTMAQLSTYFRDADLSNGGQFLNNSIMTQTAARMSEAPSRNAPAGDLGPDALGSEQAEDLFVYNAKHVTLKKGQRMVLPIAEFTVPYKDVYTLDVPFTPPSDVRVQFNSQQQAELARLLAAPKVMHKIRIENKSKFPLTTAPALILSDERVLGQGMMTFTSAGASVDLAITAAVDIQVRKTDRETKRSVNAMSVDGNQYASVDLEGKITLVNYRKEPVTIEVSRSVLGTVGEAENGKTEMVNVFENAAYATPTGTGFPAWWSWYPWPAWWHRVNGVGRITWTVNAEPGKPVELNYKWKYFWR
jgi:hypothetical protein